MRENWRNFQALRRFSNPKLRTFFYTDPERRIKYLKLKALGFSNTTSRKYTSERFGYKGDSYIAQGHRLGPAFAIQLPMDMKDESIENKVRVALAMLGESRLRALGESKPSLEAEFIGEAKQIEDSGGDVNKFIEDRVNALRLQARAVRSSVPIDRQIETGRGTVTQELPAHEPEDSSLDVEQRYLESLESFADSYIERAGIESREIAEIIKGKAMAPAKDLIRQGVQLDEGKILALAQDIRSIVTSEAAKLKEPVERADNPHKMYFLSSTRTDRFPYKKIEGQADTTQLMMIASKAAKSIGSTRPKNIAGAIRVLDRAGFRVGEVR